LTASQHVRSRELQLRYNEWHRQRLEQPVDVAAIDPRQLEFFALVVDLLTKEAGGPLLDVASGQGQFLSYAASRGLEVSGVDISDVAVEEARRLVPEAVVEVGEAESLPFPDASFDYVTCLGSLEHFPDPLAAASEMSRVLRPDGTVLIFVPNLFFLGHLYFGLRHGVQPTEGGQGFSETYRTSGGWTDLLEEAGLTVREFHPWNHIYASQRVPPAVKALWNRLSRVVPRHGAYAFAFVCTRS
jgi:SAM-dependent methyltransferase